MKRQREAFKSWRDDQPNQRYGAVMWDCWQASRESAIDEIINLFISSTTMSDGFEQLRQMAQEMEEKTC